MTELGTFLGRCVSHFGPLLSLAVLGLGPEFGDLDLDSLLDATLKLGAIAELEENLEPNKHGSKEDGLDEVVKQSRGSMLEGAVADELQDPAHYVDHKGSDESVVGVVKPSIIAGGGAANAECSEQEAGEGLQKQVESSVEGSGDGAEVEVEIGEGEPAGKRD